MFSRAGDSSILKKAALLCNEQSYSSPGKDEKRNWRETWVICRTLSGAPFRASSLVGNRLVLHLISFFCPASFGFCCADLVSRPSPYWFVERGGGIDRSTPMRPRNRSQFWVVQYPPGGREGCCVVRGKYDRFVCPGNARWLVMKGERPRSG